MRQLVHVDKLVIFRIQKFLNQFHSLSEPHINAFEG